MSCVSSVSPRIFGLRACGSSVLFICILGIVLCSAGSGVKRVVVVLCAFSCKLFSLAHVLICSRGVVCFVLQCLCVRGWSCR